MGFPYDLPVAIGHALKSDSPHFWEAVIVNYPFSLATISARAASESNSGSNVR